ncbi:DciA family protein [Pseudomonas sp. NW5]|uniref:DciA family protein n=1 Tax=Pseudomonas sp. NW5 TaxID=2934934 RepID=UPI002021536F|nr:DciA family protein [Pseudomonas sp. NW5]MCL7461532.1 DciA family protein [Pseudomonas sp. NW5]
MTFRPLHAQPPAVLLRTDRTLRQLMGAARRLEQLQQCLEQQLQPAARAHCKVASWRDGVLLLIITSSEWATRLRYQQQRLLRLLQACPEFAGLQRILMRVRPAYTPQAGNRPPPRLSGEAAQTLRSTATGISDPRLRAALERLASHGELADENV